MKSKFNAPMVELLVRPPLVLFSLLVVLRLGDSEEGSAAATASFLDELRVWTGIAAEQDCGRCRWCMEVEERS